MDKSYPFNRSRPKQNIIPSIDNRIIIPVSIDADAEVHPLNSRVWLKGMRSLYFRANGLAHSEQYMHMPAVKTILLR